MFFVAYAKEDPKKAHENFIWASNFVVLHMLKSIFLETAWMWRYTCNIL
jgi:hypothetical protein